MNIEKNEIMRKKLLVKPNLQEAKEKLDANHIDPDSWYNYAMAVADSKGVEDTIDIFSEGLFYHPFSEMLHFGRGRKYISTKRYWRAISDFTMAIRLDPEIYCFWYYRAVSNNLNGNYRAAIADFERAMEQTEPRERYCIIDWIFTCYVELGEIDNAKKFLDTMDCNIVPPQMDYSYRRRVMLYKGLIKPEDFINMDDIKSNCVEQDNRVNLELATLTFGLYIYYIYKNDQENADKALLKLMDNMITGAFGCIKGEVAARKRGLIK